MTLAAELLSAVGGVENVEALTRCWARLRFTLHDPTAVDQARVTGLPDVVIAVHQHGQYQVALRTGLLATYEDLTTLISEHPKDHHG